jgi:hypothetical protein
MVLDINPTEDSFPSDLIDVNGTIYSSANDGTHGYELRKSEGTTLGRDGQRHQSGANGFLPRCSDESVWRVRVLRLNRTGWISLYLHACGSKEGE